MNKTKVIVASEKAF